MGWERSRRASNEIGRMECKERQWGLREEKVAQWGDQVSSGCEQKGGCQWKERADKPFQKNKKRQLREGRRALEPPGLGSRPRFALQAACEALISNPGGGREVCLGTRRTRR